MGASELTADDEAAVSAFAERLFMACLGTMELANVELGVRLGLYDVLAHGRLMTARDLAGAAGIVERYAREWLEQQASAGVVAVDDAAASSANRRYMLPAAHAHVLTEDDSDACMKSLSAVVPWVGKALDIMVQEFRNGGGAAFGLFGVHDLQAAFTRPVFANHLIQTWLPALPEVQAKLAAGERVRIAELGCGEGRAAITVAQAYRHAVIDAFDLDEASIAVARSAAAAAGVQDRVTFQVRDAAELTRDGDYDLVLAIEMLHDVPDPVGVLRTMRHLAGENGVVLVVDERTADEFTLPATEMERFFYSFSTLHCLAVSMQDGGAGTGTVMRIGTLGDYARAAGFSNIGALDVDHPQFRLYRLT